VHRGERLGADEFGHVAGKAKIGYRPGARDARAGRVNASSRETGRDGPDRPVTSPVVSAQLSIRRLEWKEVTMPQSKLVLVTGATGKQGGAVVEALLTRGHQVRALTRNSASPAANRLREQGVEIAVGDFTDHDSLVRATRGADAVYAMSTPYEQGAEKETAQGITITDAARAAGVAHFIYSSVASANRAPGI